MADQQNSHNRGCKQRSANAGYSNNRNSNQRDWSQKKVHKYDVSTKTATAPYNFISLPEKVLESALSVERYTAVLDKENDKAAEEAYYDYLYSEETLSGYIDLQFKTLTPVFIRGDNNYPFMLGDMPVLPGSSLRGMFKNIFKIVTMSKLEGGEDYVDRHVFFRKLMAPKSEYKWAQQLKKVYDNRLKNNQGKSVVKPGFLYKKQDKYFIVPAKDGRDVISSFAEKTKWNLYEKKNDCDVIWSGSHAYVLTGKYQGQGKGREEKFFDSLQEYDAAKKSNGIAGKQIVRYIRLEDADWDDVYNVDLTEYGLDNNRRGVDLREKMKDAKELAGVPADISKIVPCYFVPDRSGVKIFGHGRSFRVPYRTSIGQVVKRQLKGEKVIDYTEAVFGKSPLWASRVFFEDAISKEKPVIMPEMTVHPLMQPNPTSYQLYLKNEKGKDLKHWDSPGAEVRGYKMYWHQGNGKSNVMATKEELKLDEGKKEDKKLCSKMQPIKAGCIFNGRIRFVNLHPDELGALLLSIETASKAAKIAFKIGQGKSLGLGSIQLIGHRLYLENAASYTRFQTDKMLSEVCVAADSARYKQLFEQKIPAAQRKDWQFIMGELVDMLDFSMTDLPSWTANTCSMKNDVTKGNVNDRYIERSVLPTVKEVIQAASRQ